MNATDINYDYCLNHIKENPIFNNLDNQTLESLMSCLAFKKWDQHTEFFNGDQTLYKFFIVLKGRLKMYQVSPANGREFTVFLLSKYDLFDVISLLDGLRHPINFETIDAVEVLTAPIHVMQSWIERHPIINKTLLPYFAHRMRILETNLTDNVLSDIPTRLSKLILSNVDRSSKKLELIDDLPHEEIANMIGSTRAVVNRHIQTFKKAGILKVQRKHTSIQNLQLLLDRVPMHY